MPEQLINDLGRCSAALSYVAKALDLAQCLASDFALTTISIGPALFLTLSRWTAMCLRRSSALDHRSCRDTETMPDIKERLSPGAACRLR